MLHANQVAVGIHSALDVQFVLLGRVGHLGDGLAMAIVQQVDLGGRIPCVQAGQNLPSVRLRNIFCRWVVRINRAIGCWSC